MVTTVDPATGKTVTQGGWRNHGLSQKIGAFVEGGANFLRRRIAQAAGHWHRRGARGQFCRHDVGYRHATAALCCSGVGGDRRGKPLTNKFAATGVAVSLAFAVAMIPGPQGFRHGGMILWPLFGATNQLLAGLAFLVTVFYLWRRQKPIWFAAFPMIVMLIMPAWAMIWNLFNRETGWLGLGAGQPNYLLVAFGICILALQAWIVIEAVLIWPKAKGVLEQQLTYEA